MSILRKWYQSSWTCCTSFVVVFIEDVVDCIESLKLFKIGLVVAGLATDDVAFSFNVASRTKFSMKM